MRHFADLSDQLVEEVAGFPATNCSNLPITRLQRNFDFPSAKPVDKSTRNGSPEIVDISPHSNADRLQVVLVDVGGETDLQIVCGDPLIRLGQKVPTALIGTILTDGDGEFEINQSKLRGVDSFGMLCSAKELGIGDDNSGVMDLPNDWTPGTKLRDIYRGV